MQNNFSKCREWVPRGTSQHKWRWLTTLLLIFTFAIGNVWADETYYLQDPAETNGTPALTGDFYTTCPLSFSVSKTYETVTYKKGLTFNGNLTSMGSNCKNPNYQVRYDCKTNNTSITVIVYNKHSSNAKKLYRYTIQENSEIGEANTVSDYLNETITKNSVEAKTYEVKNSTRTSIYFAIEDKSNQSIVQIIAVEKGTKFPEPGEDGYQINFNKMRYVAPSGSVGKLDATSTIEGVEMYMNDDGYYNKTAGKIQTNNTHYIKFSVAEKMMLSFVTSSNKSYTVGAKGSTSGAITPTANKAQLIKLPAAGTYYINPQGSNVTPTGMSFSIPTVSYDANGGEGSMSSNTWTVAANGFTAPSGKKFDKWNTEADGSGDDVAVSAELLENTTLYAQWKDDAPEYTVTYKDGDTELKSVNVAVGSAPTAYSPTKDFYTFAAWQKDAVDYDPADLATDAAANATITLTARWTPQYTSGTYEFTGHLTMGTDPQMTISNSSDGQNYAAGRIDNIYVSAQKIGYQNDGGDYDGWKLKTTNGTVRFMVENACGIRVTLGEANPLRIAYTEGGVAKSSDIAKSTTSSIYKADANTMVTLTNFTSNNKTVTLKKIEILPLYNATFITAKSSVTPTSASNVTEVTLPTPAATTVDGHNFTGWIADQIVYDGNTAKTAGADLTAGKTYTLTATTEFTAQWALISDFDVKFFQGYGDPDVQIGDKQTISTGNFAVAPADPTRTGFAFLGWSYDATEAHIVDVATYGITAETNFTAMWKQVFTVTFDGAGAVNVEDGKKVASPDSPVHAGKVFQGWYNDESKYDFSAAVTGNLALISKWADADANHFYYNYKDDFHFDGVVYKTPEGKTTDPEADEATLNLTNPYILFSGAEGIEEIKVTNGIYDYKKAADTKHVTSYIKINTGGSSKIEFTIAAGYTAVLKMKMGGYSSNPTITLQKGDDVVAATSGEPGGKKASVENNFNEIVYDLVAGTYTMTTATKTLYISHIDLEATALPTFTVTYVPGEGTGDEVVDNDATMVADCPAGFTAPTGKAFNGWKDGDNNDVEVGATVTESMTLTAQWINQYAVTFDMQGHGSTIATQYIKHGAKATQPADPYVIGWEFGGWYTEATCENEFDFNTAIEAATPLFAKWTEFTGCVEVLPAKSGAAIAVGDPIVMQDGSHGAAMTALAIPDGGALNYTNSGLAFATKTGVKANVVLSNDIVAGTKIILTLVAGGDKTRGLFIYTKDGAKINDFTCWVDGVNPASNGLEDTFTYTVQAGDGLEGTNEFQLWRNNTVYLKSLKVSNCGDEIIYHNLTSEVSIADKGTVTLGASAVRENHTTTATYSDIDPLYEFVSWSVSGEGASIENVTANPATITMGTEDAVVTLNLQVKPVKFTVNYYEGTTLKGTEEVTVNEYPTAAGIETAKAHYIFEGWAESPTATAADVIDLNTITSAVAATFNLYAIYTHVPCVTEGTVFSMSITDPEGTEYNENNNFGVEIGATYVGGKAYSGSKSATKRIGYIDANGEYAFENNGDVTVKIAMDCALQEGDVITFTTSTTRELKIQKVAGTDLVTTSGKKYVIPAASPLIGAYDFYLERGNSASTFKTLRVERPYTISFDLQGHGTAIAAVKQIKDEKISAPAAPTADGWDFGGWYKEAACTNAWDFDNDVVDGTATLFAKWSEHVYNDATLKSLTYGGEEIALEDGIYEYNIELPALTTAVPALAAVTNAALATKVIENAESFDGDGKATSKVTVTSEDHTVELTYTVNFTKIAAVELQDVTGDFTWDFSKAVSADKTVPTTLTVLANIYGVANNAAFKSDNLMGASGKMKTGFAQVKTLKFHATVPGKLTVVFSNTGNKEYDRILYINGVATTAKSKNQTPVTYNVVVPAGDVLIQGWETKENPEDETWNMLNFYSLDFDVDLDPTMTGESTLGGYERDVTEGKYGTICLPKAGVMVGASIYTLAYYGETSHKIFFDEVVDGTMEAGKPYLFLPNEGVDRIGVYYTNQTTKTAQSINGFVGYIGANEDAYIPVPDGEGCYIVQNNQYREVLAGAEAYIKSYRAYIKFSEIGTTEPAKAPGARRIGISGAPQVVTGVDGLNVGDQPVKLIIDGQMYILRGDKMYDATGRLVK